MADSRQPDFYMDMREKVLRGGLIVISICGLISVDSAYCVRSGNYGFYVFTTVMSMLSSVLLFVFVLLKLEELFTGNFRLRLAVVIGDIIWTFFYFLASILVFVVSTDCPDDAPKSGRVAAGVFGLFGVTVSGILAYFGVMDVRSNREEQSRVISQPPPQP